MTGGQPGTGRRPDGAAFIIALALMAMGALLIWDGARIPDRGGYSGIGPGDVPKLVGGVLILLGLATAVEGRRGRAEPLPRQQIAPVLLIVGGLALQLVLLKPLGFGIASGILFACTAAAFGKRNLVLTLPLGIIFALAVYGVFDRLLQLNLPAGVPETLIFGG
jgi:putative tricarboxylic transport membrane protein